ncbi:hypothetical protein B0H13DRAFT_2029652 [Mycena leptocephala]|nr:hypothetical protein B0H13DRAFT_2029652 [Mycena leptocephala]
MQDMLGELRGVSVAQDRGEGVEHVLRGLLPQARGEHGQVVAAENRHQLSDIHHGHLLRCDERRGLLRRDGARWDVFVRPPVQRKHDFVVQRDMVDGGDDGARRVKGRHGVRVGKSQRTEDGTHCLGPLCLACGALHFPFFFFRLARSLDDVLGQGTDGYAYVSVGDHET